MTEESEAHTPLPSGGGDEEQGGDAGQPCQHQEAYVDVHDAVPAKDRYSTSDSSSKLAGNLAALTDAEQKRRIETSPILRKLQRLAEKLALYNIESIGIAPLRAEQKTVKQWWSPGLLWFSANVNGA